MFPLVTIILLHVLYEKSEGYVNFYQIFDSLCEYGINWHSNPRIHATILAYRLTMAVVILIDLLLNNKWMSVLL